MQVVETSKRVLGQEHPSTLTSIGNLASTYRNQERWNEAEDLQVQVVEKFNSFRALTSFKNSLYESALRGSMVSLSSISMIFTATIPAVVVSLL